ncbi:MAG TPA: hypothetical protein VK772_14140, partial [Puia sp.]|nr:hypothetical protein [Puia sp.]
MQLTRNQTWIAVLVAGITLCLLYQSVWIFSRTTTAKILSYNDNTQTRRSPSWMYASYTVNYDTYYGNFLREDFIVDKQYFKIRYLIFNPKVSRRDTFSSNWGVEIMFFIIWAIITCIVFIRKDIVSANAVFLFQKRRPFVSIKNNIIEDYDEHDIENLKLDQAQQVLKLKLQSENHISPTGEIKASVYKNNPNAVGIIVIYIFYFFFAIGVLVSEYFGYPAKFIFGAILIFIPPYIQNTRNPTFKMKIPNEGCLGFSPKGIRYKNNMFALEDIESVVVYLEAFRGFKYRDRVTTGKNK